MFVLKLIVMTGLCFATGLAQSQPVGTAGDDPRRRLDAELLEEGCSVTVVDDVISRHPDSYEWHRLRRNALIRLGVDPVNHVETTLEQRGAPLAVAWMERDPERALELFTAALESNPSRLAAAGYFECMIGLGRISTLDSERRQAIERLLTKAERLFLAGKVAAVAGDLDNAIALAKKSADAAPSSALARFLWAQAELERGQPALAEDALEEGFYLDPVSPDGYQLRVELALALGDTKKAARAASSGLRRYPTRPEIRVLEIDVALAMERFDTAQTLLEQAAVLEGQAPAVWAPRAASAAWGLRDRALLSRSLAAWATADTSEGATARYRSLRQCEADEVSETLHRGYLAYLDDDPAVLKQQLERLTGDTRESLAPFAELLRRKIEKRQQAILFNWVLVGVIAAALLGVVATVVRRRRTA